MNAKETLLAWLERRADPSSFSWLREIVASLTSGAPEKTFHLAFGQAVRRMGKAPLAPSKEERAQARSVHPGWDPREWTRDQAARAALLLSLAPGPRAVRAILALHQTADLGEHLALARSLFLPSDAAALLPIAREAIRSNMRDVFAAICQHNPYPAEHCDDIAWNQMVVKCLFVDLPLGAVYGLDGRVNAELARILVDLARERRAAKRPLSPEAWRCVGPIADEDGVREMEITLAGGTAAERRGAALGLWAAPGGKGRRALEAKAPELIAGLEHGSLNWENYDA